MALKRLEQRQDTLRLRHRGQILPCLSDSVRAMPITDFDFLPGRWHVANRKLVDTLDPDCADWSEFEASSEARAILGGAGNIDHFRTEGYEGFSLRLFDPDHVLWR